MCRRSTPATGLTRRERSDERTPPRCTPRTFRPARWVPRSMPPAGLSNTPADAPRSAPSTTSPHCSTAPVARRSCPTAMSPTTTNGEPVMPMQLEQKVSYRVESEVGTLHTVIVHRPGREHTRLTPTNAEELLFDDVIWVKRAKEEHDAFCEIMRDRGVEVLEVQQLLSDVLSITAARSWVLDRVLDERHVGVYLARSGHEWGHGLDAPELASRLIGGITKQDLGEGAGLTYEASEMSDMLLPPLPNFLFQRDPSCWIYDGGTLNPMAKPARRPETVFMEALYRWHPMFARAGAVKVWHGGVEQDWGRATVEGGDVMPIGNGAVMIGMGERTAPQAVTMIARELFRSGSARLVLAVMLPRSRHYMHLDTVMTMVDRDAVTLFPEVVEGARVWSIRPGR